jgi:hypothetical protein
MIKIVVLCEYIYIYINVQHFSAKHMCHSTLMLSLATVLKHTMYWQMCDFGKFAGMPVCIPTPTN